MRIFPYMLIAPAVILVLIFRFIPLIMVAVLSLFETDFMTTEFVGFANYAKFFATPELYQTIGTTFLYVLVITPCVVAITFTAAVISQPFGNRGQHLTRLVFFIPGLAPGLIMATVWRWFFHWDGPINWFVLKFSEERIVFFSDRWLSVLPISVMTIFGSLGMGVIIFTASLKSIPRELFDVASLDGATRRQTVRYVVIPALMPVLVLVTVVVAASTFNLWGQIYMLAPYPYAASLQYAAFYEGFLYGRFGMSAAIMIIQMVVIVGLIIAQARARKWQF